MTQDFPVKRVILVDDDEELRTATAQGLALAGIEVDAHGDAASALARINPEISAALISDIRMPGMDGLELVEHVRRIDPEIPVILITGHADVTMAVDALKGGAFDFITKPFGIDGLVASAEAAVERRREVIERRWLQQMAEDYGSHPLVGVSAATLEVRASADRIARSGLDLIIEGETGVGKELVARLVHRRGPHSKGRFVAINCASLNEASITETLFGIPARGVAGGVTVTSGHLERANRGTLLLDEIDSMPTAVQPHFLRILEERTLVRPGGTDEALDLTVIATSKVPLADAVAAGTFRADLYYRLNAASLHIPPLRERVEDILPLFAFFAGLASHEFDIEVPAMSDSVRSHLLKHDWLGNARELKSFAFQHVLGLRQSVDHAAGESLQTRTALFERSILVDLMVETGGDIGEVCERLGLPRKTLYDKLARHGLDAKRFRDGAVKTSVSM